MWYLIVIAPLIYSAQIGTIDLQDRYEQREVAHIEKTQHVDTDNKVLCSCVDYVRLHRPDIPSQDAVHFVPATSTPFVGAVAVMRYPSGASHVAVVALVEPERVFLRHANVVPCKETSEWMDIDNPRLHGYL